jgi:hypothetical protein
MRNDFKAHLNLLDNDDLDDLTTALSRERARRAQKPVAEMDDNQYLAWANSEIAKAQAAKAEAARKAAEDGEE